MQVGDLVRVNVKYHGYKRGIIVKSVRDECNWVLFIEPIDHPRQICASAADVEVINANR